MCNSCSAHDIDRAAPISADKPCVCCGCLFPETNHQALIYNITALALKANKPDLIGLAEVAELAGRTRQRAYQIVSNRSFPAPVLALRSGRLWQRSDVLRYLER